MTSKEKNKFRLTKQWKQFRQFMLENEHFKCQCCGREYKKGLNVHHCFKTNYEQLDPDRFKVLCKLCHKFLHAKYKCFPAWNDWCDQEDQPINYALL